MITILSFFGVFVTFLYIYLKKHYNHWKKLGIAYDKPVLLFGSVKDSALMRKNRAEKMDEIYKEFPGEKVVGWFNFRTPALLIRDPQLVRNVLVTDFHSFRNNDIEAPNKNDPLSRNIFVLKDDEWKRTRALLTPAFTSGKIKATYPQMMVIGKEFVEYLKKHPEEIHVKDTMSRYTSEIIAKCALGIEGNSFKEEKPKMHEIGKIMFQPTLINGIAFSVAFFLPYLTKLFNLSFLSKDVSNFFDSILRDIIVYRQKNNVERNDFIQYLIELKRKTIEVEKGNIKSDLVTRAYTDEDVLAGCVTFFVENYETAALMMSHVLYNLALNKDVQDKLRQEIDEEKAKGEITYERITEMNYLNGVLQETNRVCPVTHFLFKRCVEDYEFDLGNKTLPVKKNTTVIIPLYGLHTDPTYWDDPLEFKPERFSDKEKVQEIKSKSVFMPFGDGPRMCIGMRLATTVMKVAIFQIISELEVLPSSKTPKNIELDPYYMMTTHKGGIYLRFVPRSQ